MKTLSNIAAFVKYHREKLNFTQDQLAEIAGVGIHFIRDLEQDRSALKLDKVNQVLSVFGNHLAASSEKFDPFQIWYSYFDKPVKIITSDRKEINGYLVQELRDEKSNIVAWKLVPNLYAREWQKKQDDNLTMIIRQMDIEEIELQKA